MQKTTTKPNNKIEGITSKMRWVFAIANMDRWVNMKVSENVTGVRSNYGSISHIMCA
jgi:putative SOS response-associated peptidase YedK